MSSPTCPERGGAARVTQCTGTQASRYYGSFRVALVVPGFSLHRPSTLLGEAVPGLVLWVLMGLFA